MKCKACQMEILFAKNLATGKTLPLDFESVKGGTAPEKAPRYVAFYADRMLCCRKHEGEELKVNERLAVSHYATCTDPNRFTKKGKA